MVVEEEAIKDAIFLKLKYQDKILDYSVAKTSQEAFKDLEKSVYNYYYFLKYYNKNTPISWLQKDWELYHKYITIKEDKE